ncbi:MAG: M1 family aminopeptidase, partial [Saprospiraceae bacterium]
NWDYIIVHESAHEYYGNAVSVKDHCDMWIHESFATYMEALYVECVFSRSDAVRYLESQRPFIRNLEPVLGPKDVNFTGWRGSDYYFKGSWVLHTLRNALGDDEMFFGLLRAFYDRYKYTTCTTEDFIAFSNEFTGKNCDAFFEQYLRYPGIPKLLYSLHQKGKDLKVTFKWEADVPGFDMPVKIGKKGAYTTVNPVTTTSREVLLPDLKKSDFSVATELFYIKDKEVKDL